MTRIRDVVAVCEACGSSYVEAARRGPARLEINAACPRCLGSPPTVIRKDQEPPGPGCQSGESGVSGNRPGSPGLEGER
jgi:hypothetical protein